MCYDVRDYCDQCCCRHTGGINLNKKMFRSVKACAKITLVFLNIWVLAVVMVISLGQWRVFESNEFPATKSENPHLIVMRELQEDAYPKPVMNMAVAPLAPTENEKVAVVQPKVVEVQQQVNPPPVTVPTMVGNIKVWCSRHHPNHFKPQEIPTSKLNNVLVDKRHKMLFCPIPGVAMNDWRKILLITSGVVNATRASDIYGGDVFGKYSKSVKRLSEFSPKDRAEMLTKYYKVMFVRDPLERLAVAYMGKLVPSWSKYFHKTFGSQIIKRYRPGAKPEDVKNGNNVKFNEFGKYVIDEEHKSVTGLNEHWQQYYKLCHPCLINYDFVGSFDTVEKDTAHVLKKINAHKLIASPYISAAETKRIPEKDLMNMYKTMNPLDLNNLFKIYSPDYTLFGYQCPHFLHRLMEKEKEFHDY